jgi:hypothetical protein
MTQAQRQQYQKIQIYIWALQQEIWPFEEVSKQQVTAEIIKLSEILGLDPENPRFLSNLSQKIFEILSVPKEQLAPNLPPSEILKADIESEIRARQERKLNLIYPTLNEQIKKTQKQYAQKISNQLIEEEPRLAQNPLLQEFVSQETSFKLANNLPQVAQRQIFNEVEYQGIVEKSKLAIIKELQKIGLEPTKTIKDQNFSQRLTKATFEISQTIAATPHNTVEIERIIEIGKPTLPLGKIPSLPEEILTELNQPQESLVFPPVYLLHPKTITAVTQRILTIPQVNLLKIAIENAPLDWQKDPKWTITKEIINNRTFSEDIKTTIDFLKRKGLKDNYPSIQKLQKKLFDFEEVQKNLRTGRDLPWVRILKRNSSIDNLLGRKKAFDQDLQGHWVSAKESLWDKKGSFGYYLHRGINRFRFITNTSQQFIGFITRGRYQSVGIFIRKIIYQKTIKPLLIKIGKTTVGKALKEGAKKISIWASTKLGIQLGATAAGVAAAPETAGISLLIGLAIDAVMFMFDMIRKGLFLIRRSWHEMSENPEKAIVSLVIGGALLIFPSILGLMPILSSLLMVFGAPLFSVGGAALLSWGLKATSLGSAATALSAQTATAVATTGGHVVLGSVVGVGVGALIVTQITGSAFLIPESEEFSGSPHIELTKSGQFNGDEVNGKGEIVYQISIGAKDETLIEVDVLDTISTRCAGNSPSITKESIPSPPGSITPDHPWVFSYKITPGADSFKDCLIINKITVLAKVESLPKETQEKTITYVIKIGNPPEDCPYGWPTSGIITSLPGEPRVGHIHKGIDIANKRGTPIYSTHGGSVSSGPKEIGGARGNYIEIVGTCDGKIFQTVYYHLSVIEIASGDISACKEIGLMGNTGNSYGKNGGYHLHYEIRQLGENWWTSGEYFPRPEKGDQVTSSCF